MIRFLVHVAPMVALVMGCTRDPASAPALTSTGASTGASTAAPAPQPTAADLLDQMDKRAPVPLLPMMANHHKQEMRDHLVAVQEIVAALALDDYAAVEKAAGRIGFSDHAGQMCDHMGAGAPAFIEQARAFHHTADRIGAAARDRDRTRVLTELGATLQACTACHATWKQQVVDAPTWQRITSTAPPMHGAGHGVE